MRARWHLRANGVVVAWLVAAALVAVGHRALPGSAWLMVHLLGLGGVSTAILVWSAHFTEALRRRSLPGGRRGQAVRLGLHQVAALAVVAGVLGQEPGLVVAGGAGVGLVAVWHGCAIALAARGALGLRLGWSTWGFVAAAVALPVGVAAGVLLARPDTAGDLAARAYLGHVGFMLLGWVGLTVMATLVTLWPTVLGVHLAPDAVRGGKLGLVLLGAALVVLGGGLVLAQRGVVAAALLLYAAGLVRGCLPLTAAARVRPPTAAAAWSLAAAVGWLLGSVLTWAATVATAGSWPAAADRAGALVGPLAGGVAGQVLLGSLTHLGPMVLGGGPAAVRAARAAVERGGLARVVLINGGLLLFALPTPSLVRVGGSLLALGAAVASLVALVRAVVVSRRERQAPMAGSGESAGPAVPVVLPAAELTRPVHHRLPGSAVAAVAVLLLTVAGTVAGDPAALGVGTDAVAGAPETGRTVEVEVVAQDMRFIPDTVEVAAGDRLVVVLTNADDVAHDLVLDSGAASGRVAPGAEARLDVGVVGRALDGWCSVAGHRQMGMVLTVDVTGGAQGGAGAADGSDADAMAGMSGHGSDGSDAAVADGTGESTAPLDVMAPPGVPARDATLAPAAEATVHRVTLTVQEVRREVAPGITQTLWTFGGEAPGPVLRGRVGDTFEITLVNDGSIGHSIDFHAGALAPERPMRTIEPGESLTYVFTATRSGIWMYHCSTMPMSLHIANGMAGAVVIDPPDLAPVDREYLLVQSELYLGAEGGIADAEAIAAEQPDAVVFNGHATQYRAEPLKAQVGERVRIWALDAGPSRASSFHVVGGQFDTVYSEGAYLLGGPERSGPGGAQALALQPGQGGFVELTFPEAGRYPFVSHIMVDAERGAAGLVEVTDDAG